MVRQDQTTLSLQLYVAVLNSLHADQSFGEEGFLKLLQ